MMLESLFQSEEWQAELLRLIRELASAAPTDDNVNDAYKVPVVGKFDDE
jgi:hypothetical protein